MADAGHAPGRCHAVHKTLAFPTPEPAGHAAAPTTDRPIEPHGDALIEPHGDALILPHGDRLILPHGDSVIEPHGDALILPHGGKLVDLLAAPPRAAELRAASRDWPSWDLTPRQFCDLELLLNGSFSPLTGFLGRADHDSVCQRLRLADGTLWPIPITLDVPRSLADALAPGRSALALPDPEGVMLAAWH